MGHTVLCFSGRLGKSHTQIVGQEQRIVSEAALAAIFTQYTALALAYCNNILLSGGAQRDSRILLYLSGK